jgi:signal transduction histidine kinase
MRKILVIDDDDGLRRTLESALKFFGFETSAVSTGEEGVRRAREWLPDLVLCDVNMPGMDGRAVLQVLRSDPTLATRQFVLMTGNQEQHPQREGMNLGADDYLPKPFEISQLRTCVEARLRRATTYRRLEESMLRRHGQLFGSTLPHEFMTPLNGILGFSEILREDLGKIPQQEALLMLSDIESCARRLQRTLMNYIMLVTIENTPAEQLTEPRPVLAPERVVHVLGSVASAAADRTGRNADLTTEIECVGLRCHESDLQMITEHLVDNAFGFSTTGTPVSLSLKLGNGRPVLTVSDKGRGMSPEQIDQIGLFMQFERKRFEQQGLGIGLALVKRLLDRNGGEIQFASNPGAGTQVSVEFESAAA